MQSSIDFYTKLHALGVPSALTLIQGADHAFDNAAFDAIEVMAQSIDLFLDRLMVNPKPYPVVWRRRSAAWTWWPGSRRPRIASSQFSRITRAVAHSSATFRYLRAVSFPSAYERLE